MPLSWNEIKSRAIAFSKDWEDESSENAEAKSFWDAFFNIFGVSRRRIASFEAPVKKENGKGGFIDLLWRGVLLVEHKSRGKDLDRAVKQAFHYFPGIKERDLPQYVIVSDFAKFRLYDLDEEQIHEFNLKDLYKNVHLFGFIAGYQTRSFGQEDPVNIEAAERLGRLHDLLKEARYEGHTLEVALVRLLFCLFAEDTSIFERSQFQDYIEQRTAEDGSDLGMHLATVFQTLNTPREKRQKTLDEQLAAFVYVNGRLFEETLPLASFDSGMRETLLDCCGLDWSRISPAVFGSLFQSIMDKKARRNLGAHYTNETNILKALRPLFLDKLHSEFEQIRKSSKKLVEFQKKLAQIRILDPACGCGNFLVIAYRELRLLELDVLRELYKKSKSGFLDISSIVYVDVDQFYGIEILEFPAQIAQVALWLTDHQMNMNVSHEFGQYFTRLPLSKTPHINFDNAMTLDWEGVIASQDLSYIVGNPPFVGAKYMDSEQKAERNQIFKGVKNSGLLDYVTCWHHKATAVMKKNPAIRTALVSTNSITQGEQVGVLWHKLLSSGVCINFAHRTFQWSSEARGQAAVHCVIIGFALESDEQKWIFEYETIYGEPHAVKANRINPYLVDAPDIIIVNRSRPISDVSIMKFGNQPIDGGNLIMDKGEKRELLASDPEASKYIKKYIGSREFINNIPRWCLWLTNATPANLKSMKGVIGRIQAVRKFRLNSKRPATRELANTPSLFAFISHENKRYLMVPSVSSGRRNYIPMGFMPRNVIASNLCLIIPGATLYDFGILSSTMHNTWTRVFGDN